MLDHWFWLFMSIACVVWYSTITVYVTIKGYTDIKEMFASMRNEADNK